VAWRDDVVQREYVKQKENNSSPLFDGELEPEVEVKKTSAATVRRKLSALSSLFEHLCERNAVTHNPVKGVKRPNEGSNEGKTPALGDSQARTLLNSPDAESLKGKRDRAMIAVLLFHAMRREEVVKLKVKDLQMRQGVLHFKITGKRDKISYLPVNAEALRLIDEYLELADISGLNTPHLADWPYRFSSWGVDDPGNTRGWFDAADKLVGWVALQTPFWAIDSHGS
jgi:site-specific recombinase XerD